MGHEEIGEAELLLQLAQQVEDLGLDRYVNRRDGLVEDDELGPSASARAILTRWH